MLKAYKPYTFASLLLLLCVFTTSAFASVPYTQLDKDQPSLAPILDDAMPAVVNVVVKTQTPKAQRNPLFEDPFFRRFFQMPDQQQAPSYQMAAGSGVIINAEKGTIITNNHVVENAKEITVRLSDDREFDAELVAADSQTDIAVIKVDAKNLTALPIADSDDLKVGDFVIAIGNPFGLTQTVTSGIVSGLGRHGIGQHKEENFIQTDASINPGNSGGALINLKGELVGINSAILSRSGGNIGIGFAIPSNLAMAIYDQIMDHGEVRRARLGVTIQNLTHDLAKAFKLKSTHGVVVTDVETNSPAAKAGIQSGDVITQVGKTKIKDFSDLSRTVSLSQPGSKVKIALIRDGHKKTVTAKLTKQVIDDAPAALQGAQLGAIPEQHPLAGQVSGVAVLDVQPGSPAAQAGLRRGDIITAVNQEPIEDQAELAAALKNKDAQTLLRIQRRNGALFIILNN